MQEALHFHCSSWYLIVQALGRWLRERGRVQGGLVSLCGMLVLCLGLVHRRGLDLWSSSGMLVLCSALMGWQRDGGGGWAKDWGGHALLGDMLAHGLSLKYHHWGGEYRPRGR